MDTIVNILQFIGVLLVVVLLFNFMIIVHEWGHFLAARWRGLHIEKFQIWFGKPLWKKTYNGVQYGLGTIPAGGFVALPQMAPMEMIEGGAEGREKLPEITPLDKIIVAFAGPLFSLLLAFVFAGVVVGGRFVAVPPLHTLTRQFRAGLGAGLGVFLERILAGRGQHVINHRKDN